MTREELEAKPDAYIENVTKQPGFFSAEVVDMANDIYKMRGLDSPQKQKLIAMSSEFPNYTFNLLKNGGTSLEAVDYMTKHGMEERHALEIVERAKGRMVNSKKRRGGKGSVALVIFLLILVFNLVKMWIRSM